MTGLYRGVAQDKAEVLLSCSSASAHGTRDFGDCKMFCHSETRGMEEMIRETRLGEAVNLHARASARDAQFRADPGQDVQGPMTE